MNDAIQICEYDPRYQDVAAELINAGLGDRFGLVDPSMNPDLYDIAKSYAEGAFLLALDRGLLVGTGSLMPEGLNVGRIARMHTAIEYRRLGIATQILSELERRARMWGFEQIVLETNVEWADAIGFYVKNGYTESSRDEFVLRFHRIL